MLRDVLSKKNRKRSKNKEEFWALKDITFKVFSGESLGIIGKNGAGKSTLLKILSKITPPTKGRIISRGRVASLLEVGTGFHPELTGRENIFLNGSILGLKKNEIKEKFDEIVDFAGVEKFIDMPLKHYSSGMQLRLAFAVAAHLEPEILIIDEVLAVGDAEFQKKSLGKMKDVTKEGRTVLFVSHNLQAVNTLCKRSVLLEKGEIKLDGPSNEVIRAYNNEIIGAIHEWTGVNGDEHAALLKTKVYSDANVFYTNRDIYIEMEYEVYENITNLVVGFHIINEFGCHILYVLRDDYDTKIESITLKGKYKERFKIPANHLAKGTYTIAFDLGIHNVKKIASDESNLQFYVMNEDSYGCRFPVIDAPGYSGIFRPNWKI